MQDLAGLAIEQMADAVIVTDTAGTIRVWNAAAAALFGRPLAAARGQSLDLIIPERLRAAHWEGFRRAMESGTTRLSGKPTITRALHPGGQRLYVEMSFAVVRGADGKTVGAVAVARDATARMK